MKKHFLIPTILAIGSTAVLPIVSCKDTKEKIQMIKISGDQDVIKGKQATYSAEVTTSSEEIDKTVTWSIIMDENKTGSTIDATSGQFIAGNAAGKVTIRATSVVDNTKHDEFDINVISAIKSITIGEVGDLEWDSEFTCKATVECPSGYDQTLTWEIEDENTVATIDPTTGKITTGEKSESFIVKATSVFDSTVYATKRINVVSPVKSITISGPTQQYFGDNWYIYTADVEVTSPWSNDIEWYIAEDKSGTGSTINKETGAFEAGKKAGTVVIKAVSLADPLSFSVFWVEIQSPIDWIKVNDIDDIEWNGKYTCHAICYRQRGYSGDVTWSIVEPGVAATINKTTGEITAGKKTETITVRATSVLDPTVSGTNVVNIISPIKSVSINKQTQVLPTNGTTDYFATVETGGTWSKSVEWEVIEDKSETGSSINNSGHFVAGSKEGKVIIKATSTVDESVFTTLDIYVRNDCPISGVKIESDNAIVFGQSTIVEVVGVPTIDDIYISCEVNSCDVGDTGSTWTAATNTLLAGNTAGDVTLTCKPIGYDVAPATITIHIAKNVFKFNNDLTNARISGVVDSKFTRVSVLPTISNDAGATYNVTDIEDGAFMGNSSVELINLEKATNLTNIGSSAFRNSTITSIFIPKSVQSMEDAAFYDAASLTSVVIEDGSQWSVGSGFTEYLFQGCTKLKTINLEKATLLSCIDMSMFDGCGELTSITIPASVTSIEMYAFYQCVKLTTMNFAGTKAQWKAINRPYDNWHQGCKATVVHCRDGDCGLDEK